MRRFLNNLNWGLKPRVVITDGSNLYPAVLAELWPEADHQLCVFHIIKDINKLILDALRRLRECNEPAGKSRSAEETGSQKQEGKGCCSRRGYDGQGEAHFVFKHRHLIVKRRENFTESDQANLTLMLEYLPELARCVGLPTGSTGSSTRTRISTKQVVDGL